MPPLGHRLSGWRDHHHGWPKGGVCPLQEMMVGDMLVRAGLKILTGR
jgi:hypothetical protein